MKTKKELRKEILQLRNAMSVEERAQKSREIAGRVIGCKGFQEADKLLLFASYKSEVDTTEIFEAANKLSKDIYYPKVLGDKMEFYRVLSKDDLKEGYRGIREPEMCEDKRFIAQSGDKICVIMPGTVFDKSGNRIGYGGGYYDKFLQKLEVVLCRNNVCKIAVAFHCQIVETGIICSEEHDEKVNYVMTEKGGYSN